MKRRLELILVLLVAVALITGCSSNEKKKTEHFNKGKAYFDKKDFKSARIEFKNVVKLDPKFGEAYKYLGESNLKIGNPLGAFRAYSILAKLDPDNLDAQVRLATFLLLGKQYKKAREKIDLVLSKKPDNTKALILLASILTKDNKIDQAISMYKKVLNLDQNNTAPYLGLARLFVRQKKFNEAEDILKQSMAVDKKALKPHMALFSLFTAKRDYASAEKELLKTIGQNKQNSNLYTVLGNFYLYQGRKKKSEEAYLKAVSLAPGKIRPYVAAAGFYNAIGNDGKTVEMYAKAVENHPKDVRLLETVARYYLNKGKLDEAGKYSDKIIEIRPKYYSGLVLKGELFLARKNFEKALSIFTDLAEKNPNSPIVHYYRAISLIGKGQRKLAKTDLLKSLKLKPDFIKSKLLLADISLKERNFDEALNDSKEILSLQPNNFQANYIFGIANMTKGDLKTAGESFSKLIKLQPNNPAGYFHMGNFEASQRHYDKAMEFFNKALAINPRLIDAFTKKVLIYAQKNEIEKALAACDSKIEENKKNPKIQGFALNLKGGLYLRMNKRIEAEKSFQNAIEKYPDFIPPYYSMAGIYLAQKEVGKAINQYKAVIEKEPDNAKPHMILGTIYEMEKKLDLAEQEYRAALKLNGDYAPASNNLAYLLVSRGKNLNEALELARKAKAKLPEDPGIMDTLGWVYYKKGMYGLAISEFTGSVDKKGDNPVVRYHLGLAFQANGETAKAKHELKKALDINPDFDGAKNAVKILSGL